MLRMSAIFRFHHNSSRSFAKSVRANYVTAAQKRTGVLLVNLGTPEAPTRSAVRRYLAEFLSDRRVIDTPQWLWRPLLYGVVIPLRSGRTAAHYKSIWTPEGSPLLATSRCLADKIQQELPTHEVRLAMRYGKPSIEDALHTFHKLGLEQVITLPLYPQYASCTVGTTFEKVMSGVSKWRHIPSLSFVSGYYNQSAYIESLAETTRPYVETFSKEHPLLFSYHSLPQRHVDLGDPYFEHCHETTRLVAKKLSLPIDAYRTVFQSRWLEPDCGKVLSELASDGIKQVAVVAPAFAVDCLETIEEIFVHYRQQFLDAGGQSFRYIPALNDSQMHVKLLKDIVEAHTSK